MQCSSRHPARPEWPCPAGDQDRRYFRLDVLQRSRLTLISTPASEEVNEPLTATAISA